MTSWAIVAIPEDGESVWKISSEKIPHMTLLFLGEQSDPDKAQHITEYLQHAINRSIFKFGAEVRERGILGDDSADVLFFENTNRLKAVQEFRSHLLADSVIRAAYDSAEQFPGWTPHLTLGYPSRPAKPATGIHSLPLYAVYFDRIALWIDDFDGPTFKLDYEDQAAMAMDSIAHRNAERAKHHKVPETPRDVVMRNAIARQKLREPSNLKHHGIGARKVNYKNPIDDAVHRTVKVASVSAQELAKEGRFIKHAVSGELQHGSTKESKKAYVRENQVAFLKHLDDIVGGRPSERADRRFDLCSRPDGDWILSSINVAAHTGTVEHHIRPNLDEYGMITGYELVHDQLTQEDMRYALMHYGVKGMKWGVRRKSTDGGGSGGSGSGSSGSGGGSGSSGGNAGPGTNNQSTKTRAERKADAKAAKKFDRKANIVRPKASEEAATVSVARKRSQKHGTDMLSNKELQEMVTRMNLEQQYAQLVANKKSQSARSAGQTYVADILKETGRELAKEGLKWAITEAVKSAVSNQSSSSDSGSGSGRPQWIRNQANDLPSPPPRQIGRRNQRQLT
ncbi:RNA ligase [Gordonia phage Schwartz33]|nr:RNA ligase [Gordonia phage Schwartz33]